MDVSPFDLASFSKPEFECGLSYDLGPHCSWKQRPWIEPLELPKDLE